MMGILARKVGAITPYHSFLGRDTWLGMFTLVSVDLFYREMKLFSSRAQTFFITMKN
ncbi:MAG: hypothetical protein ACFNYK_04070 [Alloprevotella tannerae]